MTDPRRQEDAVMPDQPSGVRGRRLLIAALMVCTFLTALDVLVVGTAMPTIVSQLGGMALYTWVFSSYLLASTVTVPVYGRLADIYGRKPVFTFGTLVFLLGSALCGLAQDMTQLIAFRVLQGLGAGAVFPVTLTILGDEFKIEERARIAGLFSSVWGVAGIVGPVVGGLLTDYLSWRWIFLLNLPVGAAALGLLWWQHREHIQRRKRQIDYVGAIILTTSLTGLMFGLLEAGVSVGRVTVATIGLFGLSVGLLFLFFWHERRVDEPILPLDLLTQRLFVVAGLIVFLGGVMNSGIGTFVPVYGQGVLGGTATMAGALLVPTAFTWTAGSVVGGRLLLRHGYRFSIVLGMSVITAGAGLLVSLDERSPLWLAVTAVGVQGFGMGLSMANLTIAVQNAVPWNRRGVVTSTQQFFRSIGQAIGVAALGAVFNLRMTSQLSAAGQDLSIANAVLDPLARRTVDPTVLAGVRGALDNSIHSVFAILVVSSAVAVLLATRVPRGSAEEHQWRPSSDGSAPHHGEPESATTTGALRNAERG